MALGAVLVDAGVVGAHLPVIGYANYLLVWGSMYQWGFAWRDGTLTHPRWRPYAFAAVGAAAVAGLVAWGPFPVDMIGAGERGRQHYPAVDCAAGLRCRRDRACPGGRSRRVAAARPPPLVASGHPANPRGHARLPVAHGAGGHRGGRVLPDRGDAPAADRVGRVVGAAAGLGGPAGRNPDYAHRRPAPAAPALAARAAHRAWARPALVAGRRAHPEAGHHHPASPSRHAHPA